MKEKRRMKNKTLKGRGRHRGKIFSKNKKVKQNKKLKKTRKKKIRHLKKNNRKIMKGGAWVPDANNSEVSRSFRPTHPIGNAPWGGHCTRYNSGDKHCKTGGNKKCGQFKGVWECNNNRAREAYIDWSQDASFN